MLVTSPKREVKASIISPKLAEAKMALCNYIDLFLHIFTVFIDGNIGRTVGSRVGLQNFSVDCL